MQPIEFKEQNKTYTRPASVTAKECKDLPVYQNDEEIISCWKLSFKDRIKLLFTGVLWFSVYSEIQPPICLSVDTLFEEG